MDNSYAGTRSNGLFIDSESDFEGNAVEVTVIDEAGMVIYSTPIRPAVSQGFKHAGKQLPQRLLDKAPTLIEITPIIEELTAGKTCFLWNASHDLHCLPNCFSRATNIVCAMERFAMLNGEFSMRHGTYKYISLEKAMSLLRIDWPDGTRHRASTDAEALRRVWKWLESTTIDSLLAAAAHSHRNDNNFPF